MGSPAKTLADLLEAVSADSDPTEMFALATARSLGREGTQSAIEVLGRIVELIDESHRMVAILDTSEEQKDLVRRYLDPLEPFRNFSVFHYRIKDARDNFLQPPVIQNLQILDILLSRVSNIAVLTDQARSEVQVLTEFMEHIHDLELPDNMKEALLARMVQMLDMLNHFEFFGAKNLEQKIDALLGHLAVSSAAANKKNKISLQSIAKTVAKIGVGIVLASDVANAYLSLSNSLPEILSLPAPDVTTGE